MKTKLRYEAVNLNMYLHYTYHVNVVRFSKSENPLGHNDCVINWRFDAY